MKQRFTRIMAAVALLVFMTPSLVGWGQTRAEGDELAVCQGTGSGYGTRRTLTDSHNVGWVLASGQSGYLGANNATNHNNVKPTAADLPVVKAVKSDATTSTTGYYFYYTTTAVANVGSLEFSYTGNSGNTSATAYVVVGDALSASGGNAYEIITLASNSSTAQNASLGTSGTFTYTFSETQISPRFYGFIIVTSSYKRLTAGTIKLLEGTTGSSSVIATTTEITVPSGFNNDLKNGTTAGTLTASVTETVSGDAVSGATVTWESSNIDVATINASGEVTLVAVGTTTITASYAGVEDEYQPSSDEYELEVVDSRFLVSNLTFTAACGGSGTADDGAEWTVTSDGTESNFDSNRGIHYGTASAEVTYVQLTTSDIDGEVKKVVVNASDAQGVATASVTVGGVAFTCTGDVTVTNSNPGVDYTFTGTGSGEIIVRIDRGSSMAKAIYVKSVKVTYQEVAVKAPVITVPETFIGSTAATITCETTGATIYYSYDNSTWTEYTAALTITQTTTIYAKAVKGTDESTVVSATTTRELPEPTVIIDATGITNTDVYMNTAAGSLAATVNYSGEAISGATVTWSGDNDEVATIDPTTGAVTLVAAGTVNFTATFAGNADYSSASATYELTVTSSAPYVQPTEFNIALNNVAFGCGTGNNATQQSFTINNTVVVAGCSSSASSKTYYDANHVRFYDGSYLKITAPEGYIITNTVFTADGTWNGGISVNSGTYNNDTKTWEGGTDQLNFSFTAQNRISSVAITLVVPGVEYEITYATNLTNGSFAEGNPASAIAGVPVTVQTTPSNGYYLATMTYNDGTNTENAIVSGNSGTFTMPEHNVTVSATFSELSYTNYQLVNSVSEIVSGKHYIIVAGSEEYYAMGSQNTNNRAAVEINVNDGIASVSNIDPVREVVINGPDAGGFYIIYDAEQPGYLYAAGGSGNNYLKTQTLNNEKGQWTISFDAENHDANIVANTSGSNKMRFNSSSSIFSCYASGQNDIYLYVKDGETDYTFYKDIAAYGEGDPGHWYFIASPVNTTPAAAGMLTNATEGSYSYDLYRFDQTKEAEWQNYVQHPSDFSRIVPGNGYLYANTSNVTLVFTGTPYNGNTMVKGLDYSEVNLNSKMWGWNLVGNPFTEPATVNKDYYKMNANGAIEPVEIDNDQSPIPAYTGIMVKATETGQSVTFSKQAKVQPSQGVVKLALSQAQMRGNSIMDNAIVSFNEGRQLDKFYFGESNANIYIPQNGKDYAIYSAQAQGEMPVNFKANKDGEYTITVSPEGVDLNYLHLIDNMTGMDINLLQTPSYTFDATTRDYESRFRLVFGAASTSSATDEPFAFFSNGSLIVNNSGEATLQVVDLTGRILSSERINGACSTTIEATPGVYMLRLINSNGVKTQKVVVR